MYDLPFIDMYYKTGDTAKAVKISERLAEIMGQNIDYYQSFSASDRDQFGEDLQTAIEVLRRLQSAALINHQIKLSKKIDALIKQKNQGI